MAFPPIPPFHTFRHYSLINNNEADTIYPMIYDSTGSKVIWDGSTDRKNEVTPGSPPKHFDPSVIPDGTVVTFGCKVKDSGEDKVDRTQRRTYLKASPYTVYGAYGANGEFHVQDIQVAGVDPAAFQEAYLKVNNPAVAKLLIAVANLISPEISATA